MARFEDDERQHDDDLPRRETLMQRRLRAARGEEVEDDFDDESDRPPAPYRRPAAPYMPTYAPSGGCATTVLYLMLGAITITLLFMLFGRQAMDQITQSVPERVREVIATPTPTVRDRGGTIQQIRALNRLESQQYSVERIVEARAERGNPLDLLLGDRLLLIASGDVVAGVDLSKLRESDVEISADGDSITLRLPRSEIFSARLNNDRTRVYDRQSGPLADENKDLETHARQEAEKQILDAACEGGVMQKAADEAQRSVEQLLRLLEFKNVTVVAEAGPCTRPAES